MGADGSAAITTVVTCHTANAWRTAASSELVPLGAGSPTPNPSTVNSLKPAAAEPARRSTPWGPPPPAWL